MSPKNDFKAFSTGNDANVVSQEEYEESQNLRTGFLPDNISTHLLNKVLRQSSTIASVIANFVAIQSGNNVLDDGDVAKLTTQLNSALEQKITIGIPHATLMQKGIIQLTNAVGDSDTLAVTQKLVQEIVNSLLEKINNRVPNSRKINGKTLAEDLDISVIDVGAKRPGDIYFSAHSTLDLAKGEYIANGDTYTVDSTVGRALNKLSDVYKAHWGIEQDKDKINLPNLYFYGRGVFMRAGMRPGVIQEDAIRNITGSLGWWNQGLFSNARGVFEGVSNDLRTSVQTGRFDGYSHYSYATFNASQVVPTADENRPLNVSMIPIIYLGV
ncbi:MULTISPECIES: tail fiber protein [Photorhabdus]|uniref:DNA-packaging protein n=1 Tax=Photorhabdus kayaii TaxID=230088 RepID=A0ABX0AV25_9GAMM|nr:MULTISPECIES: tail fiber protein [Photorhabdus]MCC8376312.1 tail fiber protein [Photorhabdus bodei]MCT8350300.1 phage tail protein [Photorhabdus kayaii]MDB6367795.1 tail fiber protein [Photorhabdus bodei]NDL12124.1 DNA-packaging protein [Photorhabdus kayaii]NDL24662.1 DNA-packaging protein [Photorhabdus kayaii]